MNIDNIINNIEYEELLKYLGQSSLDSFDVYVFLKDPLSTFANRYCVVDKNTNKATIYYTMILLTDQSDKKSWCIEKDETLIVKSIINDSPESILIEYEKITANTNAQQLSAITRYYLMNKIEFLDELKEMIKADV